MTFRSGCNYYTAIGEHVQDHYRVHHGEEGLDALQEKWGIHVTIKASD
jgi:hypothetical protein